VSSFHGRFAWYELITTDVEAAKAFYTSVMGWGVLNASVPGAAYTLFTAGNVLVSGLMQLPQDASRAAGTPIWLGYVGVDDVDAVADRVERLGGVVHVPPTDIPDISRFAIFTDPQAARFAAIKRRDHGRAQPAGLDAPGRVSWRELLAADWQKALAFYGGLFGWQPADADVGELGTYQQFSAGGETIGGMLTKPTTVPAAFWLYYFSVGDLDAAAQRVAAGGGKILAGPFAVPGGSWFVQCTDPQGAVFALEGPRRPKPPGYFARDPSGTRGPGWSW
jgi:uncharacterized protein